MLETTQLTCLVPYGRQIKPRGRAIWGQFDCFGLQGGAYEISWIVRSAVGGGASHWRCQGSRRCCEELIPTGKLRFGVAFAPKMSALFVIKDPGGTPRGVTVDLGNELAQRLTRLELPWA